MIAMATRTDVPRDQPVESSAAAAADTAEPAQSDWTMIEENDLLLAAATPVEPADTPNAAASSAAAAVAEEVAVGSESLRVVVYSDASFSATTSMGGHFAFLANERGTLRVPLVAKAVPQPPPERPPVAKTYAAGEGRAETGGEGDAAGKGRAAAPAGDRSVDHAER